MQLLLGITLILLILRDVFNSVVPRGMRTTLCIGPVLARRVFWPPFRSVASIIKSPELKADFLSLFAPLFLLTLLTIWLCLLAASIALVTFPLASEYAPSLNSPLTAFYVSGASVLTIGASEFTAKTNETRFLMLAGAFAGMIMTASIVSLMFTLIGSIHDREVLVRITSSAAGSPPSGIGIIETYAKMNGKDCLPSFFDEWHHWSASVFESHKDYPLLPYFRSNDPQTSWLSALGAVLDSASLIICEDPDSACFSARMTYSVACKLLHEFVDLYGLELPAHTEISDVDFESLHSRFLSTGLSSSQTEEEARVNFRILQNEYLPAHRSLCAYLAVPVTPLSSTCSTHLPVLQRTDQVE